MGGNKLSPSRNKQKSASVKGADSINFSLSCLPADKSALWVCEVKLLVGQLHKGCGMRRGHQEGGVHLPALPSEATGSMSHCPGRPGCWPGALSPVSLLHLFYSVLWCLFPCFCNWGKEEGSTSLRRLKIFIYYSACTTDSHQQLLFKINSQRKTHVRPGEHSSIWACSSWQGLPSPSGLSPGRPCSTVHTAGIQPRSLRRSHNRDLQ